MFKIDDQVIERVFLGSWKPGFIQRMVLEHQTDRNICRFGRRTGKSDLLVGDALITASYFHARCLVICSLMHAESLEMHFWDRIQGSLYLRSRLLNHLKTNEGIQYNFQGGGAITILRGAPSGSDLVVSNICYQDAYDCLFVEEVDHLELDLQVLAQRASKNPRLSILMNTSAGRISPQYVSLGHWACLDAENLQLPNEEITKLSLPRLATIPGRYMGKTWTEFFFPTTAKKYWMLDPKLHEREMKDLMGEEGYQQEILCEYWIASDFS